MTRRAYFAGVLVVAAAILFHAPFPRHVLQVENGIMLRHDRWTGTAQHVAASRRSGFDDTMRQL